MALLECRAQLKKPLLSREDAGYLEQSEGFYLNDIQKLLAEHPELEQHPALLKMKPKPFGGRISKEQPFPPL